MRVVGNLIRPTGVVAAIGVGLILGVVGCSSTTASSVARSNGGVSAATTGVGPTETAPSGSARQHIAYAYDLFHHCGLATVPFAGRMWRSDGPVPTPEPDPSGNYTYTGSTHGVMVLVAADRAEFTYQGSPTSPPKTLVFVPTTATQEDCA